LFVVNKGKIEKKMVGYVPGFVKIFDEILVNAIDHSVRDKNVSHIKICIDQDLGYISIENNGSGIPIEKSEYGVYNPELIFGNLLTSSNYDDKEQRITGGMNGMGSKLTAVFSTGFMVETCDGNLDYNQVFEDNMKKKGEPKVNKSKKKSFTKITFWPDFKKLDMKHIDNDSYSLLVKRVYDTVVCTDKRVNIYLNGEKLEQKNLKDYIQLYDNNKYEFFSVNKTGDMIWDIGVGLSTTGFNQVSFCNGIATTQGGKHVDYVLNQLTKKLAEQICSKKKIKEVKTQYIKDSLFLFVRSTVINPKFGSQSKEKLTTPQADFGVKFDLTDDFISKVYKLGVGEEVASMTNFKNKKDLDKNISKRAKVLVSKLDDANFAGKSKSSQCSLILTEGDSAKTFAVAGLSIIGRDNWGIFPLRGKMLNIREATQQQLLKNEEVLNIKKIMGLSTAKKYESEEEFLTLRYGSIVILADSDFDGFHIAGLFMNFIHYWWPALMKRDGFIKTIKTPIVKATSGKKVMSFDNERQYKDWDKTKTGKWSVKYFKGLGTSTAKEAKEIFKNLDANIRYYTWDKSSDDSVKLAFDKKYIEHRKIWLSTPAIDYAEHNNKKQIKYTDFINKDLKHFSNSDNVRSIPSLIDGLKPSQRKVIFTAFKRNQTKEVKVAQFSAAVAEATAYHHGEVSLHGTIVGMAQNFTGSNNLNLLEPCGSFGTRLNNGKDSASPRYIFTRMVDNIYDIFNKDDFNVLEYLQDDGQDIEPRFYVPSIPLVLINGAIGIGTGYSTNIPQYNPEDIVKNILRDISGKEMVDMVPWYKGFNGRIEKESNGVFTCKGVMSKTGKSIKITEIPIGTSIESYKEFLETIEEFDTVNNSTDEFPSFELKFKDASVMAKYDYKKLKLISKINTTNMHLFNHESKIVKYDNPCDIIKEFVKVKMHYNEKRRKYLVAKYEKELGILQNKMRFLTEIMDDTITIYKKSKQQIIDILTKREYLKIEESYNYLSSMNIASFNKENLENMNINTNDIKKSLHTAINTSNKEFFINDLRKIM
jgi:DNA topoisomerase-2